MPSTASKTTRISRRRNAARCLDASVPVVGPGLTGGGLLPLQETVIDAIVGAAFEVLERTGLDGLPTHLATRLIEAGAERKSDRICMPGRLVQQVLDVAPSTVTIPGRQRQFDLCVGGSAVHTGLGGAATQVLDACTYEHREATLLDLEALVRVAEACEHIHYVVRPVVPNDLSDEREIDLNTTYACLRSTAKPIGVSYATPESVAEAVTMLDIALGDYGPFRATPCCFGVVCHVVPPLRFAADACLTLEKMIELGMPVQICSAGQAGATSPAALAGALVQGLAESLAGLVLVNVLAPGHPCVLAFMSFISDLRTGAMASGSGEGAIASASAAQLMCRLDLPSTVCAGMTDAKLPDAQAGYEKACSVTLAAHAGANMINLSAGMLASLIAASAESLVIHNEMLGAVLRTVRGVEIDKETLSVEVIDAAVNGEGHFLGHPQTMARMKSDFLYPDICDRSSIDEWREAGSQTLWNRATQRVRHILQQPPGWPLDPVVDRRIREKFPIHLDSLT